MLTAQAFEYVNAHLLLGHDDLGQLLQVGAHGIGQAAEADGGEEVDGEAHVAGRVTGEEAGHPGRCHGVLQPGIQLGQAHVLRHFLHTRQASVQRSGIWNWKYAHEG